MSIYTVYQPPLESGAVAAEPYRFVFVRDGFSWWAFLLTPLWMLRHRLWLALAVYLLVAVALDAGLRTLGASVLTLVLTSLLISLLAGLEAGTLRRFKLARRHWRAPHAYRHWSRAHAEPCRYIGRRLATTALPGLP